MKTVMLVILAAVWVLVIFNRKLKRTLQENEKQLKPDTRGLPAWGKKDCPCGVPRNRWKALAMNRPDNTVLLICPQCRSLWEEQMSVHGNNWRLVNKDYAAYTYGYKPESQEVTT